MGVAVSAAVAAAAVAVAVAVAVAAVAVALLIVVQVVADQDRGLHREGCRGWMRSHVASHYRGVGLRIGSRRMRTCDGTLSAPSRHAILARRADEHIHHFPPPTPAHTYTHLDAHTPTRT